MFCHDFRSGEEKKMKRPKNQVEITRRDVLSWSAAALTLPGFLSHELLWAQPTRGPVYASQSLNNDWTLRADDEPTTAERAVTLPNTVVDLSWQGWQPAEWQRLWRYRRAFASPVAAGSSARVFLQFDGAMSAAQPALNGHALEEHRGGFLPFEREITSLLRDRNELVVMVDGRWINVPPEGGPKGFTQIDYLLPAGLHRNVSLRVLPLCFIADVFAKPVDVLTDGRALSMLCTVDVGQVARQSLRLEAELMDGGRVVGHASATVTVTSVGRSETTLIMHDLGRMALWSPESPKLYSLKVSLHDGPTEVHSYNTRVGFREARFTVDGFFLNGKKMRLFGLNRHELFPFAGFAMPDRVMRHDAEMLRHELNCNAVRCSHYPQTEAFLDACDELGMMVWQEPPGWQYVGDDAWQQELIRDVEGMIRRDRNHPSIIVWGVRVNESHNNVPLYTKTKALAKSLDDSRQTSGSMTTRSTDNWVQDVFAYDDYHALPDGSVGIYPPSPDVPFFNAEAVGQFAYEHGGGFKQYYRRAGDRDSFEGQARFHAQGHDRAANYPTHGGVLAWCAFDYASRINGYNAVKCPGVVDVFRMPKLGAAFYQSQVSPAVKPIIAPSFFWDFSNGTGPGKRAWVFANCEQLRATAGKRAPVIALPARDAYPHTAWPPFLLDLSAARAGDELVLEGLVGGRTVLTRRFSSDRTRDKLMAGSDDSSIVADGVDATRVWFAIADEHGESTVHLDGSVTVSLDGPGKLSGDRNFVMAETGGVGAVWVRGQRGTAAPVTITISHPTYGTQRVTVRLESMA
jgi:beta-galactosidase